MRLPQALALIFLAISTASSSALPVTGSNPSSPKTARSTFDVNWPPPPGYSCCVFMTKGSHWEGEQTYGCFKCNECGKLHIMLRPSQAQKLMS